jgi:hypothetical protein
MKLSHFAAIGLLAVGLAAHAEPAKYRTTALSDLSRMFYEDRREPTYGRQHLDPRKLDYSLESLKHVDEYLEKIRKDKDVGKNWNRVVLRAGAYVGEVIRRNDSKRRWQWIDFETARSINPKFFGKLDKTIALAAILHDEQAGFSFPLAKVEKYLDNGSEDSVHAFAQVILSRR